MKNKMEIKKYIKSLIDYFKEFEDDYRVIDMEKGCMGLFEEIYSGCIACFIAKKHNKVHVGKMYSQFFWYKDGIKLFKENTDKKTQSILSEILNKNNFSHVFSTIDWKCKPSVAFSELYKRMN